MEKEKKVEAWKEKFFEEYHGQRYKIYFLSIHFSSIAFFSLSIITPLFHFLNASIVFPAAAPTLNSCSPPISALLSLSSIIPFLFTEACG